MKLLTKREQIGNPSGFVTRAAANALYEALPQQQVQRLGLKVVGQKDDLRFRKVLSALVFSRGIGIRFCNSTSESKIRDSCNMFVEIRVLGIHSVLTVCWCMTLVVLSEAANSNSR